MVLDSSIRIRDYKEMRALLNVYPKKFKFVFAMPQGKPAGNTIKSVKVIKLKEKSINRLVKICKAEKIDIIHSHNHPDTYGYRAMQVRKRTGIPFVHECHDIAYHNISQDILDLEKTVMKGADHIITVSGGMKDYLHTRYKVGPKSSIIYSFPNRSLLAQGTPNTSKKFINGVYQGVINNTYTKNGKYNHRYYKNIFTTLNKQGLKFNVYPQHGFTGYGLPMVKVHKRIPNLNILYKEIGKYDFGFVGYNNTGAPFLDFALPNKLFEYTCAGIPIVAQNYFSIAKFVNKHNVGIVIDRNNPKLPKGFHNKMAICRKMARKKRFQFTMEKQAPKLLEIYQGLL